MSATTLMAARDVAVRLLPLTCRMPLRPADRLRNGLVDLLRAAEAGELAPDEEAALVDGWAAAADAIVTTPHLLAFLAPSLLERKEHAAHLDLIRHAATAPMPGREAALQARAGWVAQQTAREGDSLLAAILGDLAFTDPRGEASYAFLSRWLLFQDVLHGHLIDRAWLPLHERIFGLLHLQTVHWNHPYVGSYAYQGHPLLGIGGIKPTDERLDAYEIDRWIRPGMRVLDVGANCGFLALDIARRGARVDGIELNPFMVAVAEEARVWLGLQSARFRVDDFQSCRLDSGYDVVLSLANHSTIDGNLSMGFEDYISRIFHALRPGGLLLFESHNVFGRGAGGQGDDGDLDAKMDIAERYFQVVCHRMVRRFVVLGDIDKLFIVMRRRPAYEADAVRELSLPAARTGFEMEPPWMARERWSARPAEPPAAPAPLSAPALGSPPAQVAPPPAPVPASRPELLRKVAFVVHNPDLVHHYREVWRAMDPDLRDVVLIGETADRASVRALAAAEGGGCRDIEEVLASGQVYAVSVANHLISTLPQGNAVALVGVTRARFYYGLGTSAWNFAPWNALFDVHLVHGPKDAERISSMGAGRAIQMGYPRYDRLHRGELDVPAIRQRLGCRPGVPLVVWLPTMKEGCSIPGWAAAVSALQGDFDVVVKPHPQSWRSEPEVIRALQESRFAAIVTSEVDSGDLLAAADFVLADYGGSPFGAMIANRKLVLLDVDGVAETGLYGQDSFDLAIRRDLPSLRPDETHRLRSLLDDASLWEEQAQIRGRARDEYVAPNYGFAGRVAASALEAMARSHLVLDWSDERAVDRRRLADYRDGWLFAADATYFDLVRRVARGRGIVVLRTSDRALSAEQLQTLPVASTLDVRWTDEAPDASAPPSKGSGAFLFVTGSDRAKGHAWLEEHGLRWFEDYC